MRLRLPEMCGGGVHARGVTPAGLRQLQDLRHSLLQPPRQLRPRTATASRPGDAAENVSTVA
jgi:putative transposase